MQRWTRPTATGTITDNDAAPALVIADATATEDEGTMDFTVTLSAASSLEVTVNWQTTAGTATEGEDYEAVSGTLHFNASETEQTVTVPIIDDSLDEVAELFTVTLTNASDATLDEATATGTITDDDAAPTLTIADATATEAERSIAFKVTLSAPSSQTITVNCVTRDGTATTGTDYMSPADPIITLTPGQTEVVFVAEVFNDAVDESDETFTIILSDLANATMGDHEAIGTILDDDAPIAQAWLARFGRSVASQLMNALDQRLARSGGLGAHVTLGGQRLVLGSTSLDTPRQQRGHNFTHNVYGYDYPITAGNGGFSSMSLGRSSAGYGHQTGMGRSGLGRYSIADLLHRSSFSLSFGANDATGARPSTRWTLWNRWVTTQFRGKEDSFSLDGGAGSGLLGLDLQRGDLLTGMALSYSRSGGDFDVFTADKDQAEVQAKSWLLGLYPYLRVAVNERLSAWGLFGHGRGQMAPITGHDQSNIAMNMGGLGLRGALLSPASPSGLDLGLRSDAFLMRINSDAVAPMVSQLRLALEGTRAVKLDSGQVWTPSLEVGMRHDRGDAETGLGLEVGGALAYTDPGPGLTVKLTTRRLLMHQDQSYDEWGMGGSFDLKTGASGRGLALRMQSSYGAAASGVDRFWSPHRASWTGSAAGRAGRFNAELGYGLGTLGGLATPYADVGLAGRGTRTYGLGWRMHLEPSVRLELAGSRRTSATAQPTHELRLRGNLHW